VKVSALICLCKQIHKKIIEKQQNQLIFIFHIFKNIFAGKVGMYFFSSSFYLKK